MIIDQGMMADWVKTVALRPNNGINVNLFDIPLNYIELSILLCDSNSFHITIELRFSTDIEHKPAS